MVKIVWKKLCPKTITLKTLIIFTYIGVVVTPGLLKPAAELKEVRDFAKECGFPIIMKSSREDVEIVHDLKVSLQLLHYCKVCMFEQIVLFKNRQS